MTTAAREREGIGSAHERVRSMLHVIHSADPAQGGPIEGIVQPATIQQAEGRTVELATSDAPDGRLGAAAPFCVHALGPGWGRYGFNTKLIGWLRVNASRFD